MLEQVGAAGMRREECVGGASINYIQMDMIYEPSPACSVKVPGCNDPMFQELRQASLTGVCVS